MNHFKSLYYLQRKGKKYSSVFFHSLMGKFYAKYHSNMTLQHTKVYSFPRSFATKYFRLKTTEICHTVLNARNPRSRCQQGWFILRDVRGNIFHVCPLASGGLPAICGIPWFCCITPISAFILMLHSLCVYICLQISPLLRTSFMLD